MCTDFGDWAHAHCSLYCGFCKGSIKDSLGLVVNILFMLLLKIIIVTDNTSKGIDDLLLISIDIGIFDQETKQLN